MKNLFLALLLLQVVSIGLSALTHSRASAEHVNNGYMKRLKRQSSGPRFVMGEFSECSATCGGGFRIRMVSCLDEDGVISFDCSGSFPPSYEFCNQVDCNTEVADSNIFPASGLYFFSTPTGNVQFSDLGSGNRMVVLNINNPDGTRVVITETTTPSATNTNTTLFPSSPNVIVNSNMELLANNQLVINLNGIERTEIPSGGSVQLINGMVLRSDGTVLAPNVNMLTYYDSFRFYTFNSSIVNPLSGPGVFYYNPTTGETLYSINIGLNEEIDGQLILVTAPPSTAAPPPTTTLAPPQETDGPLASTTASPPSTRAPLPSPSSSASPPPPDTEAPSTDEDLCESERTGKRSRSRKSRKSKKSRKSRKSRAQCEDEDAEADDVMAETSGTKSRSRSRSSPGKSMKGRNDMPPAQTQGGKMGTRKSKSRSHRRG